MSSKGRGRGKKAAAAEVTQENVVDSTSTSDKIEDATSLITEKDKRGSKRKPAVAENGTTETNASVPTKRGRGRAKESTPVDDEKVAPVPAEKETKSKRGAKKATPVAETIPEKNEEITTVESKPTGPAKKGRGKKAAVEAEPEPVPETEIKEEAEPKKETKGKRGAKKDKVEETATAEDELDTNGDETIAEKESVEAAEEEAKAESPQPAKRGRGRKATTDKEEKQPVKTAAAKKMVSGGSRKRGAESKKEEEKVEPEENGTQEETAPAAAKKGGRGRKRAAEPAKEEAAENGTQEEESEVITALKRSKAQPKKEKVNTTSTNYEKIDFTLKKTFNLKISSWNVAGLRSWITKGGAEYIEHEKPDIICLQEIKCSPDQIPDEARIPGYHPYWLCKPGGYAGVAVYSKIMPINVEYGIGDDEQDADGRILTAEYEKFFLIAVYVPNAGRKLVTLPKRMRWDKIFQDYITKLNEKKPVIIAGDMNVSHQEIDLANPKTNKKNAGFTKEERDGMTKLLSLGFVDTFRHLYPDKEKAYTFWTFMGGARAKNVGWRLDYFIVSEKLTPKVVDNVMRSQVMGSDHCPITLFLNF